jgi:hypothetical protein
MIKIRRLFNWAHKLSKQGLEEVLYHRITKKYSITEINHRYINLIT